MLNVLHVRFIKLSSLTMLVRSVNAAGAQPNFESSFTAPFPILLVSGIDHNDISAYCARKKVRYSINAAEQKKIDDMHYSTPYALWYTIHITSRNKDCVFITNEVTCESGVFSTLDEQTVRVELYPNTSVAKFHIVKSEFNIPSKNISFTGIQEKISFEEKPNEASSAVLAETALQPGFSFVYIIDQNFGISSKKNRHPKNNI